MSQAPARRIVVGVDGSAGSVAALTWAAGEARVWRADLHVVHAWEHSRERNAPYAAGSLRLCPQEERAVAQARLVSTVRAALGPVPPLAVVTEVVRGLPARVLLDRAAGAALLVLGEPAASLPGVVGPVVRACLTAAPCPVVVVSAGREQAPALRAPAPASRRGQLHSVASRPLRVGLWYQKVRPDYHRIAAAHRGARR